MKLSPPWVNYYNEIQALFRKDSEVHVVFDEEAKEIKLYVDNPVKADALSHILPMTRSFGNVEVKLEVIPADSNEDQSFIDRFKAAFSGNEAVSYIVSGDTPITSSFNYVVFEKEVVQYFNDDLTSAEGFKSTLYEDIAKDVFGDTAKGVYFCTEVVPDNF